MTSPPDEDEASLRVKALLGVAAEIAGDAAAFREELRRTLAIFAFEAEDPAGRAVAEAIAADMRQPLKLPPGAAGATALVCHQAPLVECVKGAGFEIPELGDPGAGAMYAIFFVHGQCTRHQFVVDPAAAERERALMAELDALPPEVQVASVAAVDSVKHFPDEIRRHKLAIAICQFNDKKARAVFGALCRERGETYNAVPDKAAIVVHPYANIARVARKLGYARVDVPAPSIGRMRIFLFAKGRVIVTSMEIESEAEVARANEAERLDAEGFATRVFEEKQPMIQKAVARLLADEGLRRDHAVVVFGSRTSAARSTYRKLAALPAQAGFPPELPDNVSVITASYESVVSTLDKGGRHFEGIDASSLGPNQVRIITFTPGGVDVRSLESLPFSKGGSA